MQIDLPREYGLIVLEVVFYNLLLFWMGFKVGRARKKFNVPLPAAYENKPDSVFNRYQRAHHNSLEGAPAFFTTLLLSGLTAPLFTAVTGLAFIIFRYLYATGYYQGVKNRTRGSLSGTCLAASAFQPVAPARRFAPAQPSCAHCVAPTTLTFSFRYLSRRPSCLVQSSHNSCSTVVPSTLLSSSSPRDVFTHFACFRRNLA